jgi:hypothetical protein
MEGQGLHATEDLLRHPLDLLTAMFTAVSGFPRESLGSYRAQAELLQITDLSGQHAEALYRAGRGTLGAVERPAPSVLVRELDDAVADGVIPEGIDEATAVQWQKRALEIEYTGAVWGTVLSEEEPIEGATVHAGFEQAETDASGRFHLPVVPYGKTTLVVTAEGYQRLERGITVATDQQVDRTFDLEAGEDDRFVDESEGGSITALGPDDRITFEDVELTDLPAGTPVHYRWRLRSGEVRLHGVHRQRVGDQIVVQRITAPGTVVDGDPDPGDVYDWDGTELHESDATIAEVRAPHWFEFVEEHDLTLVEAGSGGVGR